MQFSYPQNLFDIHLMELENLGINIYFLRPLCGNTSLKLENSTYRFSIILNQLDISEISIDSNLPTLGLNCSFAPQNGRKGQFAEAQSFWLLKNTHLWSSFSIKMQDSTFLWIGGSILSGSYQGHIQDFCSEGFTSLIKFTIL